MKRLIIIYLLFTGVSGSAQAKLDLAEISKNVQDSSSAYYYEKLVYKFIYRPTTLGIAEAQHLYYGQSAVEKQKKANTRNPFFHFIRQDKCREAIAEGEKLLKSDPVQMEVLGLVMRCYVLTHKENRMLPLRGLQFRTLVDAVVSSEYGSDKHKTYTVVEIADEYIIAGILNVDLQDYRRTTEKSRQGMTDHWKQGRKRISFHVFSPQTEAE